MAGCDEVQLVVCPSRAVYDRVMVLALGDVALALEVHGVEDLVAEPARPRRSAG